MIACLVGLLAGFIHVMGGPDHIAAIAPYSVHGGQRSWRVGMSWGFGHASGVLLVGLLAALLKGLLPLQLISSRSEKLVGVALIIIGIWGVRSALRNRVHSHRHVHEGDEHVHIHVHSGAEEHDRPAAHAHTHAAVAVGALHGLAGSSHLLGVLPAIAMPSATLTVLYLLAFGIGTVVGMTVFSAVVGMITARFESHGNRVYQGLMGASSAAALIVGCFWLAGYSN